MQSLQQKSFLKNRKRKIAVAAEVARRVLCAQTLGSRSSLSRHPQTQKTAHAAPNFCNTMPSGRPIPPMYTQPDV